MKDTFDFTSYVRSGKLHEAFKITLDPRLEAALDTFSHEYIVIGSPEWDQLIDTIDSVTGMQEADLTDFLTGDFSYKGGFFSDYMEALDIRIDYEGSQEEPHQTTDTYEGPRGIEEIVKEILGRRLSEIQMGFEYNPKSVTGTGEKRGPKPIAFPYYELKKKFGEHFRLLNNPATGYMMKVSQDFVDAISGLKAAGRDARDRQITKLQSELKSVDPQTKRILQKGTEGQKVKEETFTAEVRELNSEGREERVNKQVTMKMYEVNWPIMGPNKTKEFLWLTPTNKEYQEEGKVNFQIDEKYLD
jgi:hypothetical protein